MSVRTQALPYPSLLNTVWPAGGLQRRWRALAVSVCGSVLIAASARLQIPFWPVPMTMQTFVVLVLAMGCGTRLGLASVGLYLLEGALGLPVFAGGAGLVYMTGPTGGYLVGFALGAALTGWLAARGFDRSPLRTVMAMVAGDALILGCGVAWLSQLLGFDHALALGLIPFLAAEVLKIALAAVLLPGVWRMLGPVPR